MKAHEKVNELYDTHKESFVCGFHDTLWQILVNQACEGAFHSLWTGELVVAQSDGGYIPTPCRFKDDVKEGEKESVIEHLNAEVFGLLEKGAESIVVASFRNQKRAS